MLGLGHAAGHFGVMDLPFPLPRVAAVFGASGGIGAALVAELRARGVERVHAGARCAVAAQHGVIPFRFDLLEEDSIADAASAMAPDPPELVLIATGVLSLPGGAGPEKSWRSLDPAAMAQVLALNTIGPAMIARHMLPLLPRNRRAVLAALSARVGSIGDNRLGGWHSYRASKAALNMLLKNLALELTRTHPQAVVAALHPGTVDTPLSAPFQGNVAPGKLFDAARCAGHLVDVVQQLGPDRSGGFYAWDGAQIAW